MSDRSLRQLVVTSSALATLAVVLGVPSPLRIPLVVGFAMLAPGLAVTRYVPTVQSVDRVALAGAISLGLNIVFSMLLVSLGEWSGEPVLAMLVALSLVFAMAPLQTPAKRRRDEAERLKNQKIRARRQAQDDAYRQVASSDPEARGIGLMALSWLLEDDGRSDEAARLRAMSRLETPPRLRFDLDGNFHNVSRRDELVDWDRAE